MNKTIYILMLAVALCGCRQIPEAEVAIHECATPPEGRACAMCFAFDGTVYVVGGRLANGEYTKTMMTYSPATDRWTNDISTPISARAHGVVCCNSNAAYLGLGYFGKNIYSDKAHYRDWWRFDPKKRKWKRLADFPSNKTVAAVAFADDEHVWVGFGFNGFSNELWCYSIADNTWEEVPHHGSWPERLMSPVAANAGGRYFQGTGFLRYGRRDFWEFFPADNHWERRASVPGEGRHNAACTATDHSVWVMGGWHYGDSLTTGYHFADILRYTPDADRWIRCGTIPCGVTENGSACAIGNTVYFGLGENDKSELHQHWYRIED